MRCCKDLFCINIILYIFVSANFWDSLHKAVFFAKIKLTLVQMICTQTGLFMIVHFEVSSCTHVYCIKKQKHACSKKNLSNIPKASAWQSWQSWSSCSVHFLPDKSTVKYDSSILSNFLKLSAFTAIQEHSQKKAWLICWMKGECNNLIPMTSIFPTLKSVKFRTRNRSKHVFSSNFSQWENLQ